MLILSIIIPAYNEEKTIIPLLEKVQKVDLSEVQKQIVIVDDNSTDDTHNLVKNYVQHNKNVRLVVQNENLKGKGSAIRTGLNHATGQIILIQDADLEYDPQDYPSLVEPIIRGEAKVVYGSRRLLQSNEKYSGLSFYLGGMFLTSLTNLLFNLDLTDEATCYKVFDSELLKSLNLQSKRFEFCPEVTAKVARRKVKIKEVPIRYYPRPLEEGKKIRLVDGVEAIWTLIKYRVVN
jgi:glycosyltransferase involved in cell wall biosynthesis